MVEATKEQKKRIAALIEPLRVEPGAKVRLSRDFDPGYRSDVVRKKDGRELLQTGIELLAEYQVRLAAEKTRGCSCACNPSTREARTEPSGMS